jgi:hypothetical protein
MAKSNKTKKLQQQWRKTGEFVSDNYEKGPYRHSYTLDAMTEVFYAKLVEDVNSLAMNATINLDGSIKKDAYKTKKLTKRQIHHTARELAKITKYFLLENQDTQTLKDEDLMQIFK